MTPRTSAGELACLDPLLVISYLTGVFQMVGMGSGWSYYYHRATAVITFAGPFDLLPAPFSLIIAHVVLSCDMPGVVGVAAHSRLLFRHVVHSSLQLHGTAAPCCSRILVNTLMNNPALPRPPHPLHQPAPTVSTASQLPGDQLPVDRVRPPAGHPRPRPPGCKLLQGRLPS